MKHIVTESRIVQLPTIKTVQCNQCSASIDSQSDYLEVNQIWGYGPEWDGDKHSFDLCTNCYKTFVGQFQIPVSINQKDT